MKYDVHDNGGKPFRVVIEDTVSIYKNTNWKKDEYNKLLKTIKPKEVILGKSTGKSDYADHKPSQSKYFLGNSILIHLYDKKYLFIGSEIYEFEMVDDFEHYFSMIGRNDVPYPVLLGKKNVYFMLDKTYVPRDYFPIVKTKTQWEEAYMYYYGSLSPETNEPYSQSDVMKRKHSLEKHSTKMKGVKKIQ
jgi:hypothetical protein